MKYTYLLGLILISILNSMGDTLNSRIIKEEEVIKNIKEEGMRFWIKVSLKKEPQGVLLGAGWCFPV